jgi:hypothetical protein
MFIPLFSDLMVIMGRQKLILIKLTRMEKIMSQEVDALKDLAAKLEDVHADVKARLDVVAGELSAEGKAEVDRIKSALDSFDAEVGDADGSDTPAAVEPGTPSA